MYGKMPDSCPEGVSLLTRHAPHFLFVELVRSGSLSPWASLFGLSAVPACAPSGTSEALPEPGPQAEGA